MHLGAQNRSFQIFPPWCGMGLGLAGKPSCDLFLGCNFTNARNGKSMSKTSLKPLALTDEMF